MRKLLLLCLASLAFTFVNAQCDNLFFSEYLEGSSNNKAIEIYNPTANTVDLTNYVIYRYNNGSPTPTDSLFPQDLLAAGDVWVAGNPSAVAGILNVSDTLHTITFFNGDDAMSLYQINPRVQLDVIGLIGNDPGTNWPVGSGATSEFTLVRMVGVQAGTTNWAVAATQYDVYPPNTLTFLGAHTMTSCIPPVSPVIQFATATTSVVENVGTVNVTVTISNVSSITPTSVEIVINGTSTATGGGVDYTYVVDTLTWPANDSTAQTLTLTIVDDALAESTENIDLGFQNPTNTATIGANGIHTVAIQDNDFPTYPIGTVNVEDTTGVADSLGLKCWVHGVVYGVNMRPAGLQFTIIDPTGGIGVFRNTGNLSYTVNETDSIKILGTIAQFNGLTQMNVDSVVLLSTGNALKTPLTVTTLGENTESDLTEFKYATLVNPSQWTGTGSGFNVDVTDGTNIIQLRIDADVNLYSMPAPVGRFHVWGIGGQFDATSPYTTGYQLLPRYDADIMMLPVAMLGPDTAFCAGGSVVVGTMNNGQTYLWNTSATTQTITVSAAGIYSVIVTDTVLNEMSYDTIVVSVQPLPVASFSHNGTGASTVQFTDGSSNATTLSWNFGDGNTGSGSNPSHTYATPGNYVVTLIASNSCGADTITDSVTVLVGIADAFAGQVQIFPNPSHGQFVVDIQGVQSQSIALTVTDQLGRIVLHQVGGLRQTVDLQAARGLYMVRIVSEQGSTWGRVIIE